MIFKECYRWRPDNKERTTDAVVVVSNCGTIVKRLPYIKWNTKNNGYSYMKEHTYKQSTNRGKQRFESEEHKKKYGMYKHVNINNKAFAVHRLVAKAFIPNPQKYKCIDHINERRDDNRVCNLRWCTNKQNQDFLSLQKRKERREKTISLTKKEAEHALSLRLNGFGIRQLAEMFNVSHETIRIRTLEIATNKQKEAIKKQKDKIKGWNRFIENEVGIRLEYGSWVLRRCGKLLFRHKNKARVINYKKDYIKKHNFITG